MARDEEKARLLLEVCAAIGDSPATAAQEVEERLGAEGVEALEVLAATEGDRHADHAADAVAGDAQWSFAREPLACSSCGRRAGGVADFVRWTYADEGVVLCGDCS